MRDGGLGEEIVDGGRAEIEVEWEKGEEGEEGRGRENGEGAALDNKELRGVGTTVEGDLTGSGVPNSKELGSESSGARYATVIATELDDNEDEEAG